MAVTPLLISIIWISMAQLKRIVKELSINTPPLYNIFSGVLSFKSLYLSVSHKIDARPYLNYQLGIKPCIRRAYPLGDV